MGSNSSSFQGNFKLKLGNKEQTNYLQQKSALNQKSFQKIQAKITEVNRMISMYKKNIDYNNFFYNYQWYQMNQEFPRTLHDTFTIQNLLKETRFQKTQVVQNIKSKKVYLAKIYQKECLSEAAFFELQQEAEAFKNLSHPTIQKIHGTFDFDQEYIQLYEFYPGQSLEQYIFIVKSIPETKALSIFFSLIKAIQIIQNSKVKLGRIKTKHILFQQNLGELPIVVVDFNSKYSYKKWIRIQKRIYQTEYAMDLKILQQKRQQFSLQDTGIILYQLLTGVDLYKLCKRKGVSIDSYLQSLQVQNLRQLGISKQSINLLFVLLFRKYNTKFSAMQIWQMRSKFFRLENEMSMPLQIEYNYIRNIFICFIINVILPLSQFAQINDRFITYADNLGNDQQGISENNESQVQQQWIQYILQHSSLKQLIQKKTLKLAFDLLIKDQYIRFFKTKFKEFKDIPYFYENMKCLEQLDYGSFCKIINLD